MHEILWYAMAGCGSIILRNRINFSKKEHPGRILTDKIL